ncbi:ABC transporter permease subunit [Myxococcota bacterium]|nr:ABC transporter permease subunit [Myxococcota bacterium]
MIPRLVRTIYKKELVDTLRDRRTLAMMLLVPMVGYPLALLATSETISVMAERAEAREVHAVVAGALPKGTVEALERAPKLTVRVETTTVATSSLTVARALLADEDADVVLFAEAGAADALDGAGTARITPPSTARPLRVERRSLATGADVGNQLASTMLPALVLVFIAISCFYPAVDLTAGEKERKTLATLLTAPVRPLDIVVGKYLAVVTVGTLAGLLNVLVLALTLFRVIAAHPDRASAAFSIGPGTWIALFFSVLLVALPVGALMLATATLARSFRDASTLLTPVLLLTTAPAVMASMPSFELTGTFAVVPLANAALLMKALILGRATLGLSAVVVAATFVTTAAILLFAARIFTDERVLFSTEGKRADLTTVLVAPPPIAVSTALVLASVVFVGNYYGGLVGGDLEPAGIVVVTQLVAHVLPATLFALWLRPHIRPSELLALSPPRPLGLAAGVVLGLGAWLGISLPAAWLGALFLPGQREAAEALRAALGLDQLPFVVALAVLAVLPAIAEELVFRGALFGLLRRSVSPITALVAQALVFGAMHGSVFRVLPTGALGVALGLLVVRTGSIWPAVVAHALTNGILLTIDRLGTPDAADLLSGPTPLALAGVAAVAAGLALAARAGEKHPKP